MVLCVLSFVSGSFENEKNVLKWLQKNHNTHPGLNLIVYSLMVIILGLITYISPSLILSFQQPPDTGETVSEKES